MRRVFLGSSREARDAHTAEQLCEDLKTTLGADFSVVPWWETNWKNLETALASLEREILDFDYAVFLAWPDDLVAYRGADQFQTRDNVVFEFGLFLSSLGKNRTFLARPRVPTGNFRILTDIGASAMTHQYDCSEGPPFQFDPSSLRGMAEEIGKSIRGDVEHRIAAVRTKKASRDRLRNAIDSFTAELEHLFQHTASDTRLLNCAARYLNDLIAYKAASTDRTILDGCRDVALYFDLVDDLLNISQLAEKQMKSLENPIAEVWVFAEQPLEFLGEGEGATRTQLPVLKKTIAANMNQGVKYRYYVGSKFEVNAIRNFVESHCGKRKGDVSVCILDSRAFRTFYTVHIFEQQNYEVYMSALMEKRNDLLIRVSPTHARRIHKRIERLSGSETSQGVIKVRNFSFNN